MAYDNQAPSLHQAPHSLAAAAALNAHEERRSNPTARRRSSVRMNLNLIDPNLPQPSEVQMSPTLHSHRPSWPVSPHHQRAPSLGEIHQELENEQEAQVNRLLQMIRNQQVEIAALRANDTTPPASTQRDSAIDDSTPSSERSLSLSQPATAATATRSNVFHIAPRRSRSPRAAATGTGSLSRNGSYRQSRNGSGTGSPAVRPASRHSESGDWFVGGSVIRDESAFYQAETQMLARENQMLQKRIRELERQVHGLSSTTSPQAPAISSNLSNSPLPPG